MWEACLEDVISMPEHDVPHGLTALTRVPRHQRVEAELLDELRHARRAPRFHHALLVARHLGVLKENVFTAAVVVREELAQGHEGERSVHAVDERELTCRKHTAQRHQ